MSYTVTIKQNSTGKTVKYSCEGTWDDGHEFQWFENNYACDCNRALFWHDAMKLPEPENIECGDGAYSIVNVITDDGAILKGDEK